MISIMRIFWFALLVLACVVPASAQTLTGQARIIDADTVEIAGERLRLEGIDAPESRQTCKRDGKRYDCGKEAASALRVKIGKSSITCQGATRDQYDRLIAVCYLDELDLNGWLVHQGHALAALAYQRLSKRYVAAEAEARKTRRGIWQRQFIQPWQWRQGDRLD